MISTALQGFFERRWYGRPGLLLLLVPLEWLFYFLTQARKRKLQKTADKAPVPLVVVGNISVGGTGKTPAIIELVRFLQAQGLKPGVISRGYGRALEEGTRFVSPQSTADEVGDEPLLIYRATGCPLAVSAQRTSAIRDLLANYPCDLILSDDGLQHYSMARDLEIVMVDGLRMLGNRHLLPVGPLRETPARLNQARWILLNQPHRTQSAFLQRYPHALEVKIIPTGLRQIKTGQILPLETLHTLDNIVALAGIGNPQKFFNSVRALLPRASALKNTIEFPDHHQFSAEDLADLHQHTLIMTEKDAVKCAALAGDNAYSLLIKLDIPEKFYVDFLSSIRPLLKLT